MASLLLCTVHSLGNLIYESVYIHFAKPPQRPEVLLKEIICEYFCSAALLLNHISKVSITNSVRFKSQALAIPELLGNIASVCRGRSK